MSEQPIKARASPEPSQRSPPTSRSSATTSKKASQAQDTTSNSELHVNIPRTWPTWPPVWNTTGQTATGEANNQNDNLTPMQRWVNETEQQSPWNNIYDAAAGRTGATGYVERGADGETGNNDTVVGTSGSDIS